VKVRVAGVDSHLLSHLPRRCRWCLYWEVPARFRRASPMEGAYRKAHWFERTSAKFGPCGKVLYADNEPAGYCQYALADCVPGVSRYPELATCLDPTGVLLTCLVVKQAYQRRGLGARLLREVVDDVTSRGGTSVETFARDDSANNCSGPTQFYVKQGFAVIASEAFPGGSSFSLVRLHC